MKSDKFLSKNLKLGQNLDHAFIPKYLSLFDENNKLYLIREFIDGMPLNEISTFPTSSLNNRNFIKTYCKNILSALSYLHGKNLHHADVSPSNVIFDPSKFQFLIDFDHAVDNRYVFIPGGTKIFSPPELLENVHAPNKYTDIYSFGKVLEFICKEKHISNFDQIIRKCTSVDIKQRYKNIQEINSHIRLKKRINLIAIIFIVSVLSFVVIQDLQFKKKKLLADKNKLADHVLIKQRDISSKENTTNKIFPNITVEIKPKIIQESTLVSRYDSIANKYSFLQDFIKQSKIENKIEILQLIKYELIQKKYRLFKIWLEENKIPPSETQRYTTSYNKKYYHDFLRADSIIQLKNY